MIQLSIVITHYQEPWRTVKPLLDSLYIQRGIDWKDIEILLIQDGEEGAIERQHYASYGLPILTTVLEHGGISKARNMGMFLADGKYVMFCDCDDAFHSAYGLHLIFSAIQEEPDIIHSAFIEESMLNGYQMFRHDRDVTFVHGKAFRRQFLIDEGLKFPEHICKHEDGAMIGFAFQITDNVKYISTPFYTWSWNPSSVMRKNDVRREIVISYPELMQTRDLFLTMLKDRGVDIKKHVAKTIFDSYYDFQKDVFAKPEEQDKPAVEKAARAFRDLYLKYKQEYMANDAVDLAEIAQKSRTLAYEHGMLMERQTIGQFLGRMASLE